MPSLHVFLSYTSHEQEVRTLQPLVDLYCRQFWQHARDNGVDVFYDHFSLEQQKWYPKEELANVLDYYLSIARMFVGFISPAYVESQWCCFEWHRGPIHRQLLTQTIYWKKDYHQADAYDPNIVDDLDGRVDADMATQDAVHAAHAGVQLLLGALRQG